LCLLERFACRGCVIFRIALAALDETGADFHEVRKATSVFPPFYFGVPRRPLDLIRLFPTAAEKKMIFQTLKYFFPRAHVIRMPSQDVFGAFPPPSTLLLPTPPPTPPPPPPPNPPNHHTLPQNPPPPPPPPPESSFFEFAVGGSLKRILVLEGRTFSDSRVRRRAFPLSEALKLVVWTKPLLWRVSRKSLSGDGARWPSFPGSRIGSQRSASFPLFNPSFSLPPSAFDTCLL